MVPAPSTTSREFHTPSSGRGVARPAPVSSRPPGGTAWAMIASAADPGSMISGAAISGQTTAVMRSKPGWRLISTSLVSWRARVSGRHFCDCGTLG